MRNWIVGVVLICAALAVATLPPAAPTFAFGEIQNRFTPERLRAVELREEALVAQEALRRRRVLDSLIKVVRGVGDRPELLVVGTSLEAARSELMESELASLTEDARAELVRLGVARPAVDLGVFTVPSSSSGVVNAIPLNDRRIEWYAGESAGRPYCIALNLVNQPDWANVRAFAWTRDNPLGPNVLGPCSFYAKHGMPGPSIQRWMQDVGASLAEVRGPDNAPVEQLPVQGTKYFRMRSSFEWGDARLESCLKRSSESCALLLTEKAVSRRLSDRLDAIEPRLVALGVPLLETDVDGLQFASWSEVSTSRMLNDLESRMGAEAFGQFWRSSQPMTVAFQEAFGTTTEAWGLAWAQSLWGEGANFTVMPNLGETALMALYLLIGLRLAMSVAARRRVG
jgi:hypothetical protein